MTKQHYEMIAALVKSQEHTFKSQGTMAMFVSHLSRTLADDNPRFDQNKFITACKPSWVVGTFREKYWDDILIP